jgi:hypothetical protein
MTFGILFILKIQAGVINPFVNFELSFFIDIIILSIASTDPQLIAVINSSS